MNEHDDDTRPDQDTRRDVDTGESGPQGGQLGSSGGGYGTGSATGSSGGTPDGEDVQRQAGPGPQTEWLRSATGQRWVDEDTIGFEPHGVRPPVEDPAERPERRLTIDPREEQLLDPSTNDPSPSSGLAEDDEHRRDLPNAEPASGGGS